MANVEFGTGKTVLILTIVAACFAILWPKIFYPMLIASHGGKTQGDNLNGCCDVIFEKDVNAIKIMTEICGNIMIRHPELESKFLQSISTGKLTKDVVDTCRKEVISVCGIDIAEFLKGQIKIGRTYRQILDEIRSFNTSICLRQNFGINPGLFGTPRHLKQWDLTTSRHLRQERPLHLRPEMMHPALRERGRAIPHSHVVPKVFSDKEQEAPNRPLPMPGMRPPLGGPGHVVPAPKGGGTMSIVMPLYTIGIVIFFMYTIMKVFVKKSGAGSDFKEFHSDPEFRQAVFEDYSNGCATANGEELPYREPPRTFMKTPKDESTRLGWKERDTRDIEIDHLRKRLEETERAMERIVAQMGVVPNKFCSNLSSAQNVLSIGLSESQSKKEDKPSEEICTDKKERSKEAERQKVDEKEFVSKELLWDESDVKGDILHEPVGADVEDTKPKIKVVGLETVAESEGGGRWSRPATPMLGDGGHSRSITPIPPPMSPEPQNIFLEGTLPVQSKLLVTESETQALTLPLEGESEPPVILSGKMTLSVISLDEIHHAQPVQLDSDVETFDDADSTLFDIDSAVIDEQGTSNAGHHLEHDININKMDRNNWNESLGEDDTQTNYTTATMSADAEIGGGLDAEETAADLSNLENLDTAEDQEEIEDEEVEVWNGDIEESPHLSPSDLYQHQR